jgi:hypothetical protein
MFIRLSTELFDGNHDVALAGILYAAIDEHVFFIFDVPQDFDVIEKWVKTHSPQVRDEWGYLITQSMTLVSRNKGLRCQIQIIDNGNPKNTAEDGDLLLLEIDDANIVINQPKRIFVENSRNDRTFLLSIIDSDLRDKILDLERNNRLEFFHGGGLEELAKQICKKHGDNRYISLMGYAIFDSDASHSQDIGESAQSLKELLEKLNIQYHCLERRAAENYVTEEVMRCFLSVDEDLELKKIIENFAFLNCEQKKYFHMKEGFSKQSCDSSYIYNGLDEKIKRTLHKGFVNKLKPIFDCDDAEISKLGNLIRKNKNCVEFESLEKSFNRAFRGRV